MKKLRTIVVDDEEIATRVILSHLELVDDLEVVGVFHSAVEAFLEIERLEVEVMFLDIQMPKLTGIEMLQLLTRPPLTVLTTAHRDYAIDGFNLDVVDYLLKPVSLDRFLKTITKIKRVSNNVVPKEEEGKDHFFLKANREYHKIYFQDILYAETLKNHIKIVTKETSLICLMTLSELQEKLSKDFVRVHRSYMINKKSITSFSSGSIVIGKVSIPIGRSYKNDVKLQLEGLSSF